MNRTLELRHKEAVTGVGNICLPARLGSMSDYEPFVATSYPYLKRIGRITQAPWEQITAVPPADLVPLNPYEPSGYRPGRTALWDAVIGIPAGKVRPREILESRRITPIRSINSTWLGPMIQGMNRIGPILPGTESRRPSGPFIYDLLYNPLGWKILEGAHVLVHRRNPDIWKKHREQHLPATAKLLQQYVAEIVTCMEYGLPLDVSCRSDEPVGTPAIAQYGIDIRVSGQFRCPTLLVPWNGPKAPIPDITMGYISTGVFIEPVPRGVLVDNENWLECNRWTCMPTIICIAGWEMMDVVSHYPVSANDNKDPASQKHYSVNPADLMPPDTFHDLLNTAIGVRGEPVLDSVRYFDVMSWFDSKDYQCGLSRTPAFPCESCLCYNPKTDGAPVKPRAMWKDKEDQNRAEQKELEDWNRTRERIMRIAEKATVFYESSLYGGRSRATLVRGMRKRNHIAEMAYADRLRVLNKRVDKLYADGVPSRALEVKKELDTLKQQHNKEMELCYQSELTSGLPALLD